MGGCQRVHDLGADGGRFAGVQGAALAQDVVERRAVHQLHDDERASVDLRHVVDDYDSGVAHPGGRAGLALHPPAQVGQFGRGGVGVGAEFLDGYLAAQDFVLGSPDDAHAAAAELGHDAVPVRQQSAYAVRLFVLPEDTAAPFLCHASGWRPHYGAAVTGGVGRRAL